jgi:RecG-like helicase
MEKDKIIKLTKALYKVTSLFPEKETLINSIRERGNLILSFLILIKNKNSLLKEEELKSLIFKCKANIEILLSYFEIAKASNWVDPKNFEILENQYKLILKDIDKQKKPKPKSKAKPIIKKEIKEAGFSLTETQERVLSILQGNGKMMPKDINQYFPEVTARSIRRELSDLKKRGIIVSGGAGRNTFYEMNSYF